jgi:hypothetical protein
VGRAIATIKTKKWQNQLPREQALEYANLLETVLPEDQYKFDLVVSQIQTNISEWLWLNVLTRKDVEDTVISLYVTLPRTPFEHSRLMFDRQGQLLSSAQWRIQLSAHPRDRTLEDITAHDTIGSRVSDSRTRSKSSAPPSVSRYYRSA